MDASAHNSKRKYPGYTLAQLKDMVKTTTNLESKKKMEDEIAARESGKKAERYHALSGWVSDYKKARNYGNEKLAKEIKRNIENEIRKNGLDAKKVWGVDPDQPKDTMKEHKAVSGLAMLVESELEKAQVVIAAKGILDKLQKMAAELSKTEADDIMPMLDSMRLTFGPEFTDRFNDVATGQIRQTMDAVSAAKEAITREVGRLENEVNGEMTNDISMDDDVADLDDVNDAGTDMDMSGDDMDSSPAPEMEVPAGGDDLDAAFDDAAADTTAAGRARKESIERNIKALTESKNPDRLVFETFRRTLTESKNAVKSAKAVAEAFAIDMVDVIAIVKEGKTYKDEKDKTTKDKDRSKDRVIKAKGNKKPWEKNDIEEGDLEEGKTFKDEKDKKDKNPFAERNAARKAKKKGQDEELGEAAMFGDGPKPKAPFGKRKADPLDKVPNNFDDIKTKKTPPGK